MNAALLAPTKQAVLDAFRDLLDAAPASFKAQTAQTIKAGINDLNKQLKGEFADPSVSFSY